MKHFLLVFDRQQGSILQKTEFADSASALNARFSAEVTYGGNSDIEVVVLGAASETALRRTHSRYFKNVSEMAGALFELRNSGERHNAELRKQAEQQRRKSPHSIALRPA
ncbi:hypothetical protein J2S43_004671 [Catenuloplanes nepalensis]|uniref:Uncharacterized protein n=1 Tax=Catenuloplanes nepalensis TaxID=587533 RepID=A0ABT9MXP6_9ACTN|nr:hypothetical protein [Catenuloplanes nepalensis]MDP9796159.1 hypothetical protein [Catenuloplanes nepalensis]